MTLGELVTVKPWRHQEDAYAFLEGRQYGALFADMGTGKSLVAVGLITGVIQDDTLIVCPKAMLRTWERTLTETPAVDVSPIILDGPIKDRIADLQFGEPHVYITNYEAFTYDAFFAAIRRRGFRGLILDESHRIKSPNSKITKKLTTLGQEVPYRFILTGTPAADKPLDVFAQLRFLSPSIVGSAWRPFMARYAITERGYNRASGVQFDKIVGYQNQEELNRIIYDHAFRVTNDVLDLPETRPDTTVWLKFDKASKRHYDTMLKESLLEVDGGEVAAANVLSRMLRLQEITSGYMQPEQEPGESKKPPVKELNRIKADALSSLLQDIGDEPVVVFYRFRQDARRIHSVCGTLDRPWFQLNGDVNELDGFNAEPNERGPVIAVQIQAGGAGIDLTKASKVIYYSNSFSLTDYEQSRARSHRPGQLRPVSYFHLVVEGTIDEVILNALRSKQTDTRHLIDGLRKQAAGDT